MQKFDLDLEVHSFKVEKPDTWKDLILFYYKDKPLINFSVGFLTPDNTIVISILDIRIIKNTDDFIGWAYLNKFVDIKEDKIK